MSNQTNGKAIRTAIVTIITLIPAIGACFLFLGQFIDWKSMFSLNFLQIALFFLIACAFGSLWFLIWPVLFDPFEKEPSFVSAIYSSAVLSTLIIFVAFSFYSDHKYDKEDQNVTSISLQSYTYFVDPDNVIHSHVLCSDVDVEDHIPIIPFSKYSLDDLYEYTACEKCTEVYYDLNTGIFHSSDSCMKIPAESREDLSCELLTELIIDCVVTNLNMCPLCY